jgi:hypothetical protein
MMDNLSRPVRRALALALLLAVLVIAVSSTILPFLATAADLSDRIEQAQELVARLTEANQTSDTDTTDWQGLATEATKRNFIPGDSPTIRMANVQSAVVKLLGEDSLKPRSIRNLPPRTRAGLKLLGVQVQISSTLAQVQSVLTRLDAQRPQLLVEDMQITPAQLSVGSGETSQRSLEVRMDIFGIEALNQTNELN